MQLELKSLTLEISDSAAAYLREQAMTAEEYASEVLRNHLESLALGRGGEIEDRPDWQRAILQGRGEISAGLGVLDEEVDEWLKSHTE